MLRVIVAGLLAACLVGCSGESATEADAGAPPDCDWFVYWLTMIDQGEPCNWGMVSKDTAVALFRTNGGECLAQATICGTLPACSDVTHVREKQVIEIWGPAGLDPDTVWAATESFDCE